MYIFSNKANRRDLIAATGLLISNRIKVVHFSARELEILWMTSKNNRALFLYQVKLCASFQIHRWFQTEVTVRKLSIWVEIGDILSFMTMKFAEWPWKPTGHLFYISSFVHCFKSMGEFKLQIQYGNAQFGSKSALFCPLWPWNLMDGLEKQ